jgi:hypothetical protein
MTMARLDLAPIAKIEWRRPMVIDITPPKRPTAEQAAARHREAKKRWQRQHERRGEDNPQKPDDVRLAHLRWRELQRLLRHRYGVVMPATAEARRDLEILIGYAILTGKKPRHQVDLLAPWFDEDEIDHLAAHQRPILHRADDLAQKLDLDIATGKRWRSPPSARSRLTRPNATAFDVSVTASAKSGGEPRRNRRNLCKPRPRQT